MPIGNNNERQWYRLDNAAKIYPAVRNARWSANFRVSVTLKDEIDPAVLQKALDIVVVRLDNFRLKLHKGVFWYYLDENPFRNLVEPDVGNPCAPFRHKENHLFRVRYYHKRIAVELFHVLTDGSGAILFLKTLAAEYLKIKKGLFIPAQCGVVDCTQPADPEEMEDAFKRYGKFRTLKSRSESRAYHFKGALQPQGELSIITGCIPLDRILTKAKENKVSLTEFIVSVMILALAQCQKHSEERIERPVKVSVPINMRRFYPSKTMRNFSLYVNPGIEPRYGEFTFEDILEEVHHFMRMNIKEKYLNAVMCKNLSTELNPVLRVVPLFVKNIAMTIGFKLYGDSLVSSTLSNLGQIQVPKEMENEIERFDFMLGRLSNSTPTCTAISYGDTLNITWTSGLVEKDVERGFFTALVKMGIPVKIESNIR